MAIYIYEETFSYEIEADSADEAVELFEANGQDYADGSEGVTFIENSVNIFDQEGEPVW